jgi:hypothetical protein
MEKFSLKTYCIGFIVPFFDTSDQTGFVELAQQITKRYYEWFDVLKVELERKDNPDQNPILLFTLVVRVDNSLVRPEQLEQDWSKMIVGIKEDMDEFLKLRKLCYEIIE